MQPIPKMLGMYKIEYSVIESNYSHVFFMASHFQSSLLVLQFIVAQQWVWDLIDL